MLELAGQTCQFFHFGDTMKIVLKYLYEIDVPLVNKKGDIVLEKVPSMNMEGLLNFSGDAQYYIFSGNENRQALIFEDRCHYIYLIVVEKRRNPFKPMWCYKLECGNIVEVKTDLVTHDGRRSKYNINFILAPDDVTVLGEGNHFNTNEHQDYCLSKLKIL